MRVYTNQADLEINGLSCVMDSWRFVVLLFLYMLEIFHDNHVCTIKINNISSMSRSAFRDGKWTDCKMAGGAFWSNRNIITVGY